jgi:broad specificity phosphatase PhoE
MPIIYLLRHAQSSANTKGILAGQDNSVELSKKGAKEANEIVGYLESLKIAKVYCSPLTRCLQTITPFMTKNPKIEFEVEPRLIEMNYGKWSGRKLSSLAKDSRWKKVINKPSTFTFPEGESFKQMRTRVDRLLADLASHNGSILLITHGDIIKMMLASTLNLPIDRFQAFVAEPASISTIRIEKKIKTVLQTNHRVERSNFNLFKSNQLGGGNLIGDRKIWWKR